MIILILKYENGMAIEKGVAKCTKTIYYIYSREVQVCPSENYFTQLNKTFISLRDVVVSMNRRDKCL
jgi:hypothetical protein